jgi:hypothetical protein
MTQNKLREGIAHFGRQIFQIHILMMQLYAGYPG